ncbi:MAG: hypothetical protein NUV85_01415 [Candidatus Berkelbacteria bacterium]|nr:hypothetical protein [Candidatus Berkelbacteria bacterium]
MNNIKHHGFAQIFFYPKGDRYIGVCLELDIVDDSKDFPELRERMVRNVTSYVSHVVENGLDRSLLNRPAPKEYWEMFRSYINQIQKPSSSASWMLPNSRSASKTGVRPVFQGAVESVSLARC